MTKTAPMHLLNTCF